MVTWSLFVLIIVSVAVSTIMLLPMPSLAADFPNEVVQQLKNVAWTKIDSRSHVKFQPEKWRGADDLSFGYRIAERDGTLFLQVSVVDDVVRLKNGETIVSDHVELWLADPLLLEEQRERLKELRTTAKNLAAWRKKSKDTDWISEPDVAAEDIRKATKRYQSFPYYTQLLFNQGSIASSKKILTREIRSRYIMTPQGYDFFAAIPLPGVLDLKKPLLESILYLVDVVDIDAATAEKQKTLMSSAAERKYAAPATFGGLRLSRPLNIDLPVDQKILMQLGDGYLKAEGEGLLHLREEQEPIHAVSPDGLLFPAFYKKIKPSEVLRFKDVTVWQYNNRLALQAGRVVRKIDLSAADTDIEVGVVSQRERDGKYYIVLSVSGPSSWPMQWHCSAGTEDYYLWITFDHKLDDLKTDEAITTSCVSMLDARVGWKGETASFCALVSGNSEAVLRTVYDEDRPELGFQVSELSRDADADACAGYDFAVE